VRLLFRFVLIKLRHCGHLALSSSLTLRAKLVLHLVELCSIILCSAVGCPSPTCHCSKLRCQPDFNKDLLLSDYDVCQTSSSAGAQKP